MAPLTPRPEWVAGVAERLNHVGLDIMGVADGRPYAHILPDCQAVLVFGSSGTRLWTHALQTQPADARHPIDHTVRDALPPDTPGKTRWLRCADDATVHIDFRRLAMAAGLGHMGRFGLVLHPHAGPWWGLRAACLTTEPLRLTSLETASPCAPCDAPCTSACPAGAIQDGALHLETCLQWQRHNTTCESGCLARVACPVGRSATYGGAQHRYHHHAATRTETWARAHAAHYQDGSVV